MTLFLRIRGGLQEHVIGPWTKLNTANAFARTAAGGIEYPAAGEGSTIECPHCQQSVQLGATVTEEGIRSADGVDIVELLAGFDQPIKHRGVSVFYQLGLLLAALMMVMLPVLYIGLIGLALWHRKAVRRSK